jgi:diguanylate cyclase (GGDEF)-like protein
MLHHQMHNHRKGNLDMVAHPRATANSSTSATTSRSDPTWIKLARRVEIDASVVKDIPPYIAARVLERLEASDLRYAHALHLQSVLQRLASTDELTELANRRALEDRLELEIDRARRYGRSLTVVMCDIDGFKRINDVQGHGAGDVVLVALAKRLGEAVRHSDLIGRWGGDEFLAVCPELQEDGARGLARKLEWAARQPLEVRGQELRPAISIGWKTSVGREANLEGLVDGADRALYQAKRRAAGAFWTEWALA